MERLAMSDVEAGSPTDLQGLFESRAGTGDFLTAGKIEDTVGLCLSGGGYRAMLYHVGSLIRLNELGLLSTIREIASVSGGSITAGKLALAWPSLTFESGVATNFVELVAQPLMNFATLGVDIRAVVLGLLPGRSAGDEVQRAYDKHLFFGASLQDVCDSPRFTFMTTNLQTGSGWRFAKDYAADFRVGRIDRPNISLAKVVAASSAFPPILSPVRLSFEPGVVQHMEGADLHKWPFTEIAVLTDGGVYDNMGLERVWKRCRTVLVSNAGRTTPDVGSPTGRWIGQFFRTLALIQQQSENSRKRILMGMHNQKDRKVAYWSIDTPISAFGLADALDIPEQDALSAASIRTRLNPFTAAEINLLLNVGYAGADAAIRRESLALNARRALLPSPPTAI
jgi:NTE family protein